MNFCIEVTNCISKRSVAHELIYQYEFFPLEVYSDCVVIELIRFREYFTQHLNASVINFKKYDSLNESTLRKFKHFIFHLLKQTDKIVLMLPPQCEILDYIEIFDDALLEEELQL